MKRHNEMCRICLAKAHEQGLSCGAVYDYARQGDGHTPPADTIGADEWARIAKAKRLTNGKIAALLPAWIKRHMAETKMPEKVEFIPHLAPKFDAYRNPLNIPARVAFPSLTCAIDEITPDELDRYVQQFDTMNALKPTGIKWVKTDGNYA